MVGWTWYAKSHQRTALNTNCKLLLLLTYVFETLGTGTVYFKVHVKDIRSQQAVLRLGANFIDCNKRLSHNAGQKRTRLQPLLHYLTMLLLVHDVLFLE